MPDTGENSCAGCRTARTLRAAFGAGAVRAHSKPAEPPSKSPARAFRRQGCSGDTGWLGTEETLTNGRKQDFGPATFRAGERKCRLNGDFGRYGHSEQLTRRPRSGGAGADGRPGEIGDSCSCCPDATTWQQMQQTKRSTGLRSTSTWRVQSTNASPRYWATAGCRCHCLIAVFLLFNGGWAVRRAVLLVDWTNQRRQRSKVSRA